MYLIVSLDTSMAVERFPSRLDEEKLPQWVEKSSVKGAYVLMLVRVGYGRSMFYAGIYKKSADGLLDKIAESNLIESHNFELSITQTGKGLLIENNDPEKVLWDFKLSVLKTNQHKK
jgi:hypothetical protein